MFESYILPVLIVAAVGCAAGILLTVCSKVFAVEVDERIEKITDVLPKANCGSCGFAGCSDYAGAIVNDNADITLCRPGGSECAAEIGKIMGVDAGNVTKMTAVIHCNKSECDAGKFKYDGVQSCKAVKRFYGGNNSCKYGCIGLGDCAEVCEYDALKIVNGIAAVCYDLCVSCGKCVKVCPNNVISLKPYDSNVIVRCSSNDMGKDTKMVCQNGCIGCKICEKQCEHGAIHVENFHAVIDYDKCTSCGKCAEKCPVKAIEIIKAE